MCIFQKALAGLRFQVTFGRLFYRYSFSLERCLCPKRISVFWYSNPPYTRYGETACNNNNVEAVSAGSGGSKCHKGILYNVVNKMIQDVCGTCEKVSAFVKISSGEGPVEFPPPRVALKRTSPNKRRLSS